MYLDSNPFEKASVIVFIMLYNEITSLRLEPGTKLIVNQLAESIEVSRTPVIDALSKLREMGFVEKKENSGYYHVSSLDLGDMIALYQFRAAIEGEAVWLCAKMASPDIIERLDKLSNDYVAFCSEPERKYAVIRFVDPEFHQLIVDSCGNYFIQQSYSLFKKRMSRYQMYSIKFLSPQNPITTLIAYEHLGITNAIKSRIPDTARKLMENHINMSCQHFLCTYNELIY